MSTEHPRLLLGGTLLTLAAGVVAVPAVAGQAPAPAAAPVVAAPDGDLGCGSAEVTRTLESGSAWRMCARIDRFKGLVLEQVQFRPATGDREHAGWLPVLDSVYLAQLNVPYDSAAAAFDDVTDYGFGDDQLLAQSDITCPGEALPVEQAFMRGTQWVERTVPGICVQEVDAGLAWHSQAGYADNAERYADRGRALRVSSLSKISWYEYEQLVTLTDQGTITLGLGATGDLAPGALFFPDDDPAVGWPVGPDPDQHATSHWHNATYRVDFGIDTGDQQVEQWDYHLPDPTRPARLEGTGQIRAQAFSADPDSDRQTWWRVLNPTSLNPDGHPRSYEIVNDSIQNPHHAVTAPPVSFTNADPCQEYASSNLNAGCPGLGVPEYVAGDTGPLVDPVAWVNVGFHHIDRDEDQSPMPVHWQEFSLVPRDLLAQQATTPAERTCVNGSVSLWGSCAAVSVTRPVLTPSTTPVRAGTTLESTVGTWRRSRDVLAYQRVWLRDGQPIALVGPDGLPTSATGESYVVTAADEGHRIAVQVTASAAGVTPGTATSDTVTVTGPEAVRPRLSPRLKVSVRGSARKQLRVVVRGTAGPVTGSVRLRAPGWHRTRVLEDGKLLVAVPRTWAGKRIRILVDYRGDASYLPARTRIRPSRHAFGAKNLSPR